MKLISEDGHWKYGKWTIYAEGMSGVFSHTFVHKNYDPKQNVHLQGIANSLDDAMSRIDNIESKLRH